MESCVYLVHLKNVERQLSQRQQSYNLAAKAGLCPDNKDKFTLYENDFKNLKSHWLIPYLKEYVPRRQDLLNGKSHSFMVMTAIGLAFNSCTFALYLSAMFEWEVNIHAGTTKLRHVLVMHVLSLPEVESLRLCEGLAELMRHSLKHQHKMYCHILHQDRTLLTKIYSSLAMAAKQSAGDIYGSKETSEGSCSDDAVCIGDIVALVDTVSTCAEDASILLA